MSSSGAHFLRRIKSESLRSSPAPAFPEIFPRNLCLPQCFPLRRPRAALLYFRPKMRPKSAHRQSFSARRARPSESFPQLFPELQLQRCQACRRNSGFSPGGASRARNGLHWHRRHGRAYRGPAPRLPDGNLRSRLFRPQHLNVVRAIRGNPARRILRGRRCQRFPRSAVTRRRRN